ncbi:MAG: hypothetical protein WBB19_05705 [Desulforhopalus sp.]
MNTFFGLIVMTGPLFLIVLWVPVCLALAFLVGNKIIEKSLTLRITGGLTVFLIALFLPVSDEIAGRIYFNHLCKTEAGVKVYQTIELPAENWDEDGDPNFYDKSNGNLYLPLEQYVIGRSEKMKRALNIEERHSILYDKETNELLSKEIWFLFWRGWVLKNFSPHNSALRCDGGIIGTIDYYLKLFKQKKPVDSEENNDNN